MRRAASETGLVKNENGTVTGIWMPGNYCAEHENGINPLRSYSGGLPEAVIEENRICDFSRILVNKKKAHNQFLYEETKVGRKEVLAVFAIGRFYLLGDLMTMTPEQLKERKLSEKDSLGVRFAKITYDLGLPEKINSKKPCRWEPQQTIAAWDTESCAIVTRDPEVALFLKDLAKAYEEGDMVMHISKPDKNPFAAAGLVLGIAKRVSQEVKDAFKAGYEDRYKLEDAAKATGIVKKLEKAGLRYFALSSKWANEIKSTKDGEIKTNHPVIFFLNPYEQGANNSGWYTVEDLEAWIKGEGPIPKKNKRRHNQ
jgi:hypothetical protein